MKLRIIPIYGWGWFQKDGSLFEVPPAFDLEVEVIEPGDVFKTALGRAEGDHPLSGMWILLAQRHLPADGACSLYAFHDKPTVPKIPDPLPQEPDLSGYAMAQLAS
jgi:hypothetical protein